MTRNKIGFRLTALAPLFLLFFTLTGCTVPNENIAVQEAVTLEGEGGLSNLGPREGGENWIESEFARREAALSAAQADGNPARVGSALIDRGNLYAREGKYESALSDLNEALDVSLHNDDRDLERRARANIAAVYSNLRQYENALGEYQTALAIGQEIDPQSTAVAQILNDIGFIQRSLGRFEDALFNYQAALAIFKERNDRFNRGRTLGNIGSIYAEMGAHRTAIDYYQQALEIAREEGDLAGESGKGGNIGAALTLLGEFDEARGYLEEAVRIASDIGDPVGEWTANYNLGVFHEMQGDLDAAERYYRTAIDVFEGMQAGVQVEEFAATFAERQASLYARLIRILAAPERSAEVEAFAYVERAKARAFLNQFGKRQIDVPADLPADLVEQEREASRQIAALQNLLRAEAAKPLDEQQRELIRQWQTGLEQVRNAHADLLNRLELAHPEYAALVSVTTLDLDEVQSEVLDAQTTLIEYYVADDYALAWIITQDEYHLVPLDVTGTWLRKRIPFLLNLVAAREFDATLAAELHQLLFAHLEPLIQTDNLVIVPHDVLHYLPFAALWNSNSERYLIEEYIITYAPSASVLKFILEKRNPNNGRLLALGNPDGTLPYAEIEVRDVAELYGTTAFVQAHAIEGQVANDATQADILHLAAHGVYDSINPMYSRIELAPDAGHDGHLEVHEVFGLDLTNANLVVLSACDTTKGQLTRGDEVVGLTRAFLYAGAPSVVTTLWPVDDAASGTLMKEFYTGLRDGLTTAEALQAAQLAVLGQTRWERPYFWAAFGLTGDYLGSH